MAKNREFEVPTEAWRVGGRGDTLRVIGVDVCAVVALYNPYIILGYLGHVSENWAKFQHMLRVARQGAASPADVNAWVGGVAYPGPKDPDRNEDFVQALPGFRRAVEQSVREAGFSIQEVRWTLTGQRLDLALNCTNGRNRLRYY